MTFAALIDERVAALNRDRMGDEYTPDAWMPYVDVLAHWFVFVDFVRVLDRAARDPFATSSVGVLLCAGGLIESAAFELAGWLTDVGEALKQKPLVSLPRVEVIRSDKEE